MAHATSHPFSPRKQRFPKHGQIEVIFGPMFSGKTTELLRRMKRYEIAKHECLLVKYAKDNRYDEHGVATHDRQVAGAVSCTKLEDIKKQTHGCNVIGIDEGQFFPDVVEFAENMANEGKTVIVAALDGDFQRKGFGSILQLVPLAENVIKLNAVCMLCYEPGSFTKRLGSETAIEVIGGVDKYMAACRSCHLKIVNSGLKNEKPEEEPVVAQNNEQLEEKEFTISKKPTRRNNQKIFDSVENTLFGNDQEKEITISKKPTRNNQKIFDSLENSPFINHQEKELMMKTRAIGNKRNASGSLDIVPCLKLLKA